MEYTIVICSHKRISTLTKKTLATLSRYSIPKESIYIFVAPEELPEYSLAFPEYHVVQGALGLANQRNAVAEYFEAGTPLFCLDDDITGFFTTEDGKTLLPLDDLDAFIRQGFHLTLDRGFSLWSLYPVKNAAWLKQTVSVGLVFCYGCCFGLLNCKDLWIESHLKEDYERSLKLYLRDGGVLRLNWVAPGQSYLKGTGGLSDFRTREREEEACDRLVFHYPTLVKKRIKRQRVDVQFPRRYCDSVPRPRAGDQN